MESKMGKAVNNKQASVDRVLNNARNKKMTQERKQKNKGVVKKQDNVDKLLSKKNAQGMPKFANVLLNWLDKLMGKLNDEDKEAVRAKMNKRLSKQIK